MCKHSILAERDHAGIRYCHDCQSYKIMFQNILLNLSRKAFFDFKKHLSECYEYNIDNHCCEHRQVRDITFNTQMDGLQFVFSTQEVGEFLSLIQEAEMSEMSTDERS
ncbi:MAG: hypothetical protein ACJAT4_001675 [Granulosicoccus sp.]|jgi:hypothetical protein